MQGLPTQANVSIAGDGHAGRVIDKPVTKSTASHVSRVEVIYQNKDTRIDISSDDNIGGRPVTCLMIRR